jgi:hypothetical protein
MEFCNLKIIFIIFAFIFIYAKFAPTIELFAAAFNIVAK